MRRYIMAALVFAPSWAQTARADFTVANSRSLAAAAVTPAAAAPAEATPVPDAASAADTTPNTAAPVTGAPVIAAPVTASSAPTFRIAQGFGQRVPLSFAVRQIVPRTVKVSYGPGASPDALVDWRGGQGWNWVLFRAVHPLGLRLVMTQMAVQIRK